MHPPPDFNLQPPPNWGRDPLTEFFQTGLRAAWASFVVPTTRPLFEHLQEIDETYLVSIGSLNGHTPNYFEGLMLVSAHAAFRSAAQFALEGRTCEAMVLLRSSLEYAMYGVHFHRNPALVEVWSKRGDGPEQRRAVREAFATWKMLKGVEELNQDIGSKLTGLYELTIDMGAHPNEVGFFGRLVIEDLPENASKKFLIKYLAGGDHLHHETLKNTCRVGLCVLECFELIYGDQFAQCGVAPAIKQLRTRLQLA
jgi:hypothetical protein